MSEQSLHCVRQTQLVAEATGTRWCGYCQAYQPVEGFKKRPRGRTVAWICKCCQDKRKEPSK